MTQRARFPWNSIDGWEVLSLGNGDMLVKPNMASQTPAQVHECPVGAVSVLNPQGTEETGDDRPAAPFYRALK
jgi:hypothetical protein